MESGNNLDSGFEVLGISWDSGVFLLSKKQQTNFADKTFLVHLPEGFDSAKI